MGKRDRPLWSGATTSMPPVGTENEVDEGAMMEVLFSQIFLTNNSKYFAQVRGNHLVSKLSDVIIEVVSAKGTVLTQSADDIFLVLTELFACAKRFEFFAQAQVFVLK